MVGVGKPFVEPKRLFVKRDGLVYPALLERYIAQIGHRAVVLGVEFYGLLKRPLGSFGVTEKDVGGAALRFGLGAQKSQLDPL